MDDLTELTPEHLRAIGTTAIDVLTAENLRLRAVNAKLLKALEETATERHKDAYPINNLHALAFTDCRESRCTQARDVIEEARK